MNSTCRFVAVSAVVLLVLGGSGSALGEVPHVLYAGPENDVAFVRIDSVLKPDGSVDETLFSQYDAEVIRAYMKVPEEAGCVRLRGVLRDHVNMGPLSDTREAVREARLVIQGVVTAQAQGFMGSEAGTLVEIESEETLKGTHQNGGFAYHVFFPTGDFELAGRSYCAFNPDWPALPAIGDRLLLFIRSQIPASSFLPLLDGTDVIVLRKSGPDLPARYKAERALKNLTSASIVEKVRAYIQEEQRQ